MDTVDYNGVKVLEKRLLDPACGSGTFLVTALQRYLEASDRKASEKGWDWVISNLCNKYRIVGFDIHPFATIMAQIQFTLVLLPYYKKALEDDPRFVLQRIPIFRTDSLKDETKSEEQDETESVELPLEATDKKIGMRVELPVQDKKEGFFKESFDMPRLKLTLSETDLYNNEEYFGALQGLFDVVKSQAEKLQEPSKIPDFDKSEFERVLKKHYLSSKNWGKLSEFFEPFARDLLQKIHHLQSEFDDGRLIKSIEDIFLAALLKNEQKYDYVVGNPPYVSIQSLPGEQKADLESNYMSASGNYDIYLPFIERGLRLIREDGLLGYINSNRYAKVNYGQTLRELILREAEIVQYVDFKDANLFKDATNYPVINIFRSAKSTKEHLIKVCRFYSKYDYQKDEEEILDDVVTAISGLQENDFIEIENFDCFIVRQDSLTGNRWIFKPPHEEKIFRKIHSNHTALLKVSKSSKPGSALFEGSSTGAKKIFVVRKLADFGDEILIKSERDFETYDLEKEIVKNYIEDAGKWYSVSDNYVAIFPYTQGKVIKESEFKANYPKAYSYLKVFREELAARKSLSKSKNWYEYSAPRSLEKYDHSKIVINGFSKASTASLDSAGEFVFGPDIYGLELKEEYKGKESVILAILNSNVTNYYIKHVGVIHRGGSYKFEDRFLKGLPLALNDGAEIENLLRKVNKISQLRNKISSYPISYYRGYEEVIEKRVTVSHSHSNMQPQLERNRDGSFNLIIGDRKKEKPIILTTRAEGKFVKKALEGRSVKKGEEIEILVPKSNRAVKEVLQKYEEDKSKLEELPTVEELEEEINQIVYDLYGLDKEDIEVIEEFLEKF